MKPALAPRVTPDDLVSYEVALIAGKQPPRARDFVVGLYDDDTQARARQWLEQLVREHLASHPSELGKAWKAVGSMNCVSPSGTELPTRSWRLCVRGGVDDQLEFFWIAGAVNDS